jgi:hypothetical protein
MLLATPPVLPSFLNLPNLTALSYLILSCLVLSCLVLSYLILTYLLVRTCHYTCHCPCPVILPEPKPEPLPAPAYATYAAHTGRTGGCRWGSCLVQEIDQVNYEHCIYLPFPFFPLPFPYSTGVAFMICPASHCPNLPYPTLCSVLFCPALQCNDQSSTALPYTILLYPAMPYHPLHCIILTSIITLLAMPYCAVAGP